MDVVQRNRKNSELNNWSEHENEYGDLINDWTETDTLLIANWPMGWIIKRMTRPGPTSITISLV